MSNGEDIGNYDIGNEDIDSGDIGNYDIGIYDWTGEHETDESSAGALGKMSALEFVEGTLEEEPYEKQKDILRLMDSDTRRISVVGCNGSGKDWTTARIALWWVHRYSPAMAVITGPTMRQVEDIVWNELRAAHAKAADKFPDIITGKMLRRRYVIDEESFALGFTSNSPNKMLGFHSPNLLAVITEAHAISDEYYHAVRRLNPAKLALTGNPFSNSGVFYDSHHRHRNLWDTVQIGADDTPNIETNRVAHPGTMTLADIDDHMREWGDDSPMYISSVLGLFPENSDEALVPLTAARAAAAREIEADGALIVACDVAHKGHDHTVVMRRQGGVARIVRRVRGHNTMEVSGILKSYCDANRVNVLVIDAVGVGAGVADRLNEVGLATARILEFKGNEVASREDRFSDRNAEVWWAMREHYLEGKLDTDYDENLLAQVSGRGYGIDSKGRVKLESKKDLKDSPDEADALAMTFAPLHAKGFGFKMWMRT